MKKPMLKDTYGRLALIQAVSACPWKKYTIVLPRNQCAPVQAEDVHINRLSDSKSPRIKSRRSDTLPSLLHKSNGSPQIESSCCIQDVSMSPPEKSAHRRGKSKRRRSSRKNSRRRPDPPGFV